MEMEDMEMKMREVQPNITKVEEEIEVKRRFRRWKRGLYGRVLIIPPPLDRDSYGRV